MSSSASLVACNDDRGHDHVAIARNAGGSSSAGADAGAADVGATADGDAAPSSNVGAAPAQPGAGSPDAIPPLASSRGRLLVADGDPENPRVVVVDLDDGSIVARFATLGTPRAYSTDPTSGYAYAVQNVPGLVEIFGSGISRGPAGSLLKGAPAPIDTRLEGPRPVHWVSHDQWVVSFNDGDGSFDYLLESSLGTSRVLKRRASTGIAHHGVAVITHGNVIASQAMPDPADATKTVRTGVTVRKLATPDTVVEMVGGCPGLHGEAATQQIVAFGCSDGILLGERKDGKLAFRKLTHPDGKPIGTLRAKDGVAPLVANLRDTVKGIDVGFIAVTTGTAAPVWAPVDIGAPMLAFLFEHAGNLLLVLGADGALRRYDVTTGAAVGSPLPVVDAHAMGTAPALAVGTGVAFVLDPRTGMVTEVDLAAWQTARKLNVGGQPISAAAFGFVPATAGQ